ncbi:MAG TPA: hypothetical protein VE981_11560 [Planctomycetota bacterium]|nr:hypothetical protein [Planctomycetota bacterium]
MKHLAAPVFLLLSALPAAAQDETVGVKVREWWARMSGTLEAESGGSGSTRLDLSDDLGLGNQNLTTELQIYGRIPVVGRIYAGWWRAQDSGSATLDRTITFAGQTFPVGTPIDSDFQLDVAYLNYEFVFPTIPVGDLVKFELAASLGIRGFHGEGMISGGGFSAEDKGNAGLPTVGAHATVKFFDLVRTEVEVLGLAFRYGDNEVHYLEMFAEATIEPLPWIFAGVGYKLAALNFLHEGSDRFRLNIDIAGVYVTAGIRF